MTLTNTRWIKVRQKRLKLAINEAGIKPEDMSIMSNAHGYLYTCNEKGESGAIVSVLGKEVPVSHPTKSFTGHLLGAAGAVGNVTTTSNDSSQLCYQKLL